MRNWLILLRSLRNPRIDPYNTWGKSYNPPRGSLFHENPSPLLSPMGSYRMCPAGLLMHFVLCSSATTSLGSVTMPSRCFPISGSLLWVFPCLEHPMQTSTQTPFPFLLLSRLASVHPQVLRMSLPQRGLPWLPPSLPSPAFFLCFILIVVHITIRNHLVSCLPPLPGMPAPS